MERGLSRAWPGTVVALVLLGLVGCSRGPARAEDPETGFVDATEMSLEFGSPPNVLVLELDRYRVEPDEVPATETVRLRSDALTVELGPLTHGAEGVDVRVGDYAGALGEEGQAILGGLQQHGEDLREGDEVGQLLAHILTDPVVIGLAGAVAVQHVVEAVEAGELTDAEAATFVADLREGEGRRLMLHLNGQRTGEGRVRIKPEEE